MIVFYCPYKRLSHSFSLRINFNLVNLTFIQVTLLAARLLIVGGCQARAKQTMMTPATRQLAPIPAPVSLSD